MLSESERNDAIRLAIKLYPHKSGQDLATEIIEYLYRLENPEEGQICECGHTYFLHIPEPSNGCRKKECDCQEFKLRENSEQKGKGCNHPWQDARLDCKYCNPNKKGCGDIFDIETGEKSDRGVMCGNSYSSGSKENAGKDYCKKCLNRENHENNSPLPDMGKDAVQTNEPSGHPEDTYNNPNREQDAPNNVHDVINHPERYTEEQIKKEINKDYENK